MAESGLIGVLILSLNRAITSGVEAVVCAAADWVHSGTAHTRILETFKFLVEFVIAVCKIKAETGCGSLAWCMVSRHAVIIAVGR